MAAGMMCIAVSAACEEKVASMSPICGRVPAEGWMSAMSLRSTAASEMTAQNLNAVNSHKLLAIPNKSRNMNLPVFRTFNHARDILLSDVTK